MNSWKPTELEEALYLVQMDWLLDSESGLLFKIREEVFALEQGYEKIFWRDYEGQPSQKPVPLSIYFDMSERYLFKHKVA